MENATLENEHDYTTQKKGRHRKKQLYRSILQQMEFYFSDSNLSKDRFLSQLIQENPYVALSVFLNFNKIRKLTTNIDDIRKAISKSELIELSEDGLSIKRQMPIKEKPNVDECTVYIEKVKGDATHDWLQSVFSEFGKVVYVSIPKYKNTRVNKGFAFVEFETEHEARTALEFFESIGCKMPSHVSPDELCSIVTYDKEEQDLETVKNSLEVMEVKINAVAAPENPKKRKRSADDGDNEEKKLKSDDESNVKETTDASEQDLEGKKKKKLKKEHKKKNHIKDLGLQILSKKEWKKMRNFYLDLQRKKMREFKRHLHKQHFHIQNYENKNKASTGESEEPKVDKAEEAAAAKLEFTPGVIVKIKLNEPCSDAKKLKNEVKSAASENSVKFVDVPLPAGSEEIYVRLENSTVAEEFCKVEGFGEKTVLHGEEEKKYWEVIENNRQTKLTKAAKKQRGRDKLLKKAKKVLAQHTRFEEEN